MKFKTFLIVLRDLHKGTAGPITRRMMLPLICSPISESWALSAGQERREIPLTNRPAGRECKTETRLTQLTAFWKFTSMRICIVFN